MNTKISTKKAILSSLGALIILIVSQIAAELVASCFVLLHLPMGICNIIAGILYLFFAYIIIKQYTRKLLKRNLESMNIRPIHFDLKWILVAFLLPISITIVYLLLPGEFVPTNTPSSTLFATLSAGIFHSGIAAGIVEELVFRGIILNLLKERWNKTVAILIPSLIFGLVHIIGMKFTLLSCFLVIASGTLVGIMFSLISLTKESIWNSAIVHVLWNIIIIGGFLTISESSSSNSLFHYVIDSKNFALTGGEFGIESSVIAVIGYCIVICLCTLSNLQIHHKNSK